MTKEERTGPIEERTDENIERSVEKYERTNEMIERVEREIDRLAGRKSTPTMPKPLKKQDRQWWLSIKKYFEFPDWPRLSPTAFSVWAFMLARQVEGSGLIDAPYSQVMEWTGIRAKSTVARAVRELSKKKYVYRIRSGGGPGTCWIYRLVPDEEAGRLDYYKLGPMAPEIFLGALDQVLAGLGDEGAELNQASVVKAMRKRRRAEMRQEKMARAGG